MIGPVRKAFHENRILFVPFPAAIHGPPAHTGAVPWDQAGDTTACTTMTNAVHSRGPRRLDTRRCKAHCRRRQRWRSSHQSNKHPISVGKSSTVVDSPRTSQVPGNRELAPALWAPSSWHRGILWEMNPLPRCSHPCKRLQLVAISP